MSDAPIGWWRGLVSPIRSLPALYLLPAVYSLALSHPELWSGCREPALHYTETHHGPGNIIHTQRERERGRERERERSDLTANDLYFKASSSTGPTPTHLPLGHVSYQQPKKAENMFIVCWRRRDRKGSCESRVEGWEASRRQRRTLFGGLLGRCSVDGEWHSNSRWWQLSLLLADTHTMNAQEKNCRLISQCKMCVFLSF